MKLLILLLPALFLTANGCLRIFGKTATCACKTLKMDKSNIEENEVKDNALYDMILRTAMKAPEMLIDDCSVHVYCEGRTELYIFDTDKGAKTGVSALNASCDPYQQKWQLDLGNGIEQYKELKAVCVFKGTEHKCLTTNPTTILFAYSNDLDYIEVEDMYTWFEGPITYNEEDKYYEMAIARFDTKTKEDIAFFQNITLLENYQSAHDHMNKLKVDPSLSFDSSETGSDVLDMLERYIDSGNPLVCGSRAVILMKRSPNEVEISKIVRKIRQYHIELIFAVEDPSSGGLHPETLYNLAAKTNGFCSFSSELIWAIATLPQITNPYIHYSLNVKVSGTGTMVLPSITLKKRMTLVFYLAVQSTATTTSFQNFTIRYVNTNEFSNSYGRIREDHLKPGSYDGYETSLNSFRTVYFLLNAEASTYDMNLEYGYSMEDTILFRLTSNEPINDWMPFQD
ncbi:hypothetical protein B9Z55_003400 [Caenorhabditis nigoni]|uniref:DUF7154 domain-containing protein n=1 Tax=Caenorhabditis nigoni TaxID=1611254 RepID=A0A2G5VQ64_9PELO|nr:hypothetical protein B9Z55_003400 [Caenorhabditis nigoni]